MAKNHYTHPNKDKIIEALLRKEKREWICTEYGCGKSLLWTYCQQLGLPKYHGTCGEKIMHKGKLIYKSRLGKYKRKRNKSQIN